jgi:hypothetical protein
VTQNLAFAVMLAPRLAICTLRCRAHVGSGGSPERHSQKRTSPRPPAPAPQAPQQPALQRPERSVERGPAPPPKVDPITAALKRGSSEAPRGSGGQRKAPGGRRGKQQWPKEGRALAGWRVQAQRAGNSVSCVNMAMVQLQHVSGAEVEADASGVMRDALQLLRSDVDAGDGRLASFLDALGSAVQAHEALAAAIAADASASAQIVQALDCAAKQEATYTNEFCTAQLATAQEKLQQYCVRFWRKLERSGLEHAGPKGVATVLHRASVLAAEHGAPAPSEALWEVLQVGVASTAPEMDAQQVSNCWYACARLGRAPQRAAENALTEALVGVCHSMSPQAVANTWWAIAKLKLPLNDHLRTKLLVATLRTSRDMVAQAVSNVWYALALLGMPPQGAMRDALVAGAVRVSAEMDPQAVANTLWALARLELSVSTELQAALLAAIPRVSEQMTGPGAAMAVWALGEFGVQSSGEVQRALCDALVRTACAAPLKPRAVRMARRGLEKLRWPVNTELKRALARPAA